MPISLLVFSYISRLDNWSSNFHSTKVRWPHHSHFIPNLHLQGNHHLLGEPWPWASIELPQIPPTILQRIKTLFHQEGYEDLFINQDFPLFTKPLELVGLCMRDVGNPSVSTNLVLATLVQLPPSTIKEHIFLLIRHIVWYELIFRCFHLWWNFYLRLVFLTINSEDLSKIPTGHDLTKWLSKCEGALHRGKDEKQDMVRMRCNRGSEKWRKVTPMVVMASQMMHCTHIYEWNPRATKKRN